MSFGFRERDERTPPERTRERIGTEKDERERTNEERPALKTVTIRGVDGRIYDDFSQVIQMSGLTIGEAITKMLRDVSKDFDEVFPQLSAKNLKYMINKDRISVQHYDSLSISLKDLEEADKSISFQHISQLTLEEDITTDAFETYIKNIQHCSYVRVPAILPKLLIYSKISYCGNIEVYSPEKMET